MRIKSISWSRLLLVAFCCTYGWVIGLKAQPNKGPRSIFDLLMTAGTDKRKVELEAPFDTLFRGLKNEVRAEFRFEDDQGQPHVYRVKLELRGRYRRRICDFPPIKLDFDKDQLEALGLSKQDDIKLVTHCKSDAEYRQIVWRELLAYQLYAVLDSIHLRTQALDIRYMDSGTGSRTRQIGFLIEDEHELAKRAGLYQCEDCMAIDSARWNRESLLRTSLFQYMIGNADWSAYLGRNIKLLSPVGDTSWFCVPYDFDFAGMVDASYAIPRVELDQYVVTQRVYLGPRASEEELEAQFDYFRSRRSALEETTMDFSRVGRVIRKQIWKYLDGFFREMESGRLLEVCSQAKAYGEGQ